MAAEVLLSRDVVWVCFMRDDHAARRVIVMIGIVSRTVDNLLFPPVHIKGQAGRAALRLQPRKWPTWRELNRVQLAEALTGHGMNEHPHSQACL